VSAQEEKETGGFKALTGEMRTVDRMAYRVGAILFVSGILHAAILIGEGGSWAGPLSLRKAATFGLSFGLTLVTITWVASFLRLGNLARNGLVGILTAVCTLETALVSLQAWRGVPSHFNMETSFDAFIARTLAVGGAVLVAVIVWLTLAAFRENRLVPLSLRIAIRVGFVALVSSMLVGVLMIVKGMRLVFAGDPWAAYATSGALKPTHFITMHAILALPLLAWLLSFAKWSERRRVAVVLLASVAYVVLATVVAVMNFSI
jgi:hypothetical protein